MQETTTGKRVFILGAGSSIGHLKGEYPGISNIFAFAKRLLITVDSPSARSPVERYQRLYEFIRENFGQSILDQSAAIAAKELALAEEVVLWGYSLPPTDFYSKWLLRQARTGNLKRLTIINPAVVNNPRPGDTTKVTLGRLMSEESMTYTVALSKRTASRCMRTCTTTHLIKSYVRSTAAYSAV